MKLNYFSIVLVFLSNLTTACTESFESSSVQRVVFENSITKAFGGGIQSSKVLDAITPSLDIHLHLSSIKSHIDTVVDSCQALNLNFYMSKNSEKFQLRVRIYEELEAPIELLQVSSNDYISFEGGLFQALSATQSLSLETYTQRGEEQSDTENTRLESAWQARFNQDGKRFQITPKRSRVQINDDFDQTHLSGDDEVVTACANFGDQRTTRRLLIRQSLTYDGGDDFHLALLYAPEDSFELTSLINELEQKVFEALQEKLDGIFVFHNPSDISRVNESVIQLKKVLDQSTLFTWALPSELDRTFDGLKQWKKLFAYENFAADFQAIRLLFMDSTLLHMTQEQLDQLDQWLSDEALSPSDPSLIHTRALVSVRSFSNPLSGPELSYQQDALRTLNRLRKARMTHQFIGIESFNESLSDDGQAYLGTQIFAVPKPVRILLIKIPQSCLRDQRGNACFSPKYIDI